MVRIVIPVSDRKGLDDDIFEHFGHTPYFLVIDIDNGEMVKIETIENPFIEKHAPGVVPSWLKGMGVNVIICRGMGMRAKAFFEELGISVVTGASGKVREILDLYLHGELKSVEYKPKEKYGYKL